MDVKQNRLEIFWALSQCSQIDFCLEVFCDYMVSQTDNTTVNTSS